MNVECRGSTTVREVVDRFTRYYNRRHDPVDDLVADVDETTAIADLLQGHQDRIELKVRKRTEEEPSLEEEEEVIQEDTGLRAVEIPQANEVMEDKAVFDALLHGVAPEVVIVLYFDRFAKPAGEKIAPAFVKMAHMFWPKALLFRVDVDSSRPLVMACGVTSIPTFVFFRSGDAVDLLKGDNEMILNVKLSKWMNYRPPRDGPRKDSWGAGLLAEAPRGNLTSSPAE